MLDKFKSNIWGAFFMLKYSYEEKLEAVLRVVEDGMGCGTSDRIMGVRHSLVEGWVARTVFLSICLYPVDM